MPKPFAALAVARRAIALSLFVENQLDHVRHRQLHSSFDQAERGVIEFINRAIDEFGFDSCAIYEDSGASLVSKLNTVLEATLRQSSISIRPVERQALFTAFSRPPLKTKHQLRQATNRIWPLINDRKLQPLALDSAALGLYAQVQRLFEINLLKD